MIIAGGFAEGHMEPSAFDEMLRVLKKGGYIINVMREENRHKCAIYKNTFDKHCQELVDRKTWTKVREEEGDAEAVDSRFQNMTASAYLVGKKGNAVFCEARRPRRVSHSMDD